jgi:hypothetical protein
MIEQALLHETVMGLDRLEARRCRLATAPP